MTKHALIALIALIARVRGGGGGGGGKRTESVHSDCISGSDSLRRVSLRENFVRGLDSRNCGRHAHCMNYYWGETFSRLKCIIGGRYA